MTLHDRSYGIIPLQKKEDQWQVLLVQLHAGHWGFPKGHADRGEKPLDAAKRELFEETGLLVSCILCEDKLEESYFFKHEGQLIHKTVTYFIAEVEGDLVIQDLEIKDVKWVSLEEAADHMTFEQGKSLCSTALQIISQLPQ